MTPQHRDVRSPGSSVERFLEALAAWRVERLQAATGSSDRVVARSAMRCGSSGQASLSAPSIRDSDTPLASGPYPRPGRGAVPHCSNQRPRGG